MSVTLVHPAKAVGRNEMPFGRDTHVVPLKLYYTGALIPTGREDLGVGTPSLQLGRRLAYHQITVAFVAYYFCVFIIFSAFTKTPKTKGFLKVMDRWSKHNINAC